MEISNFENKSPFFVNGDFYWYIDDFFNNYLKNEQDFNLPKLDGYFCFIVKNKNEISYVLINDNREVVKDANYNIDGHGQIQAFINMLKISKYYESQLKF